MARPEDPAIANRLEITAYLSDVTWHLDEAHTARQRGRVGAAEAHEELAREAAHDGLAYMQQLNRQAEGIIDLPQRRAQ